MQKNLLTKFNTLFLIKPLQKVAIEGTYINIIKAIDDKHTTKMILNGEKLKAFPLRLGTRQGCPPLPLLSNIVLEALTTPVREEKEVKGIEIGKEELKLSLADDTILYIENLKDATIKLLELIINLVVIRYKIKTHKSFAYTNSKGSEWEIKETILFTNATQRIKYLGINLPSKNNTQLWMSLVIEARSDAIKSNIA